MAAGIVDGGIGDDRGQNLVGEAGNRSVVVDQLRECVGEGGSLCQEGVNLEWDVQWGGLWKVEDTRTS